MPDALDAPDVPDVLDVLDALDALDCLTRSNSVVGVSVVVARHATNGAYAAHGYLRPTVPPTALTPPEPRNVNNSTGRCLIAVRSAAGTRGVKHDG